MSFILSRRKHGQKVFTSLRRGYVIFLPHDKCSLDELFTLQKETDKESSTSINEENMDDNNAS